MIDPNARTCPCCGNPAEPVGGRPARICRTCARKAVTLYGIGGVDTKGTAITRYLREHARRS